MAAAAVVAALAVGMWVGRSVLPTTRPITSPGTGTTATLPRINDGAAALQAAYISDPKYRKQREALVKSLEAQLASLPPDSRAKVISSLATIHKSMQDLEAELGKDPSNALLQELLVNTYQDEMRVLTTVHEASDAGEGI
jgi:N-acyl-D-aspartate/D-glutamate deacylase